MSIQELRLNELGFYEVAASSDTPCIQDQVASKRDSAELKDLHKTPEAQVRLVPENFKPDLEAIYDSMSPRKFEFFVENSKYLHKLIADDGVIDQIKTLAVVNPYPKSFFAENGWGVDSEPVPYGGTYRYSVKDEMRHETLVKDGSLTELDDFAQGIIDGHYNQTLVIKPEQSANGDGQIRIIPGNDQITLKVYNSTRGNFAEVYLGRSEGIDMHCQGNEDIVQTSDDKADPRVYEISLANPSNAKAALMEVLKALSTISYNEETNALGIPVEELPEIGLHQSADSALVEPELDLLKLDDSVIEARFFLAGGLDGKIHLTYGSKYDNRLHARRPSLSFLKVGKAGNDLVNIGDQGKEWPDMAQDIITATGRDIDEKEFVAYMETLLKTQYTHLGARLVDLKLRIKAPLQFDIAWDATQTVKVPKQFGEGFIEMPRPILMEWNPAQI